MTDMSSVSSSTTAQTGTSTLIKVAVAGINGRMGRASVPAILGDPALTLVGAYGKSGAHYSGKKLSELFRENADVLDEHLHVSDLQSDLFKEVKPDVILDFMVAEASLKSTLSAIASGVRVVIGSSGITKDMLAQIDEAARKHKIGVLVVPNFSVGAVLMMRFAEEAARYFNDVEVVEMHHKNKVDAPSGTAMHTLNRMANSAPSFNQTNVEEHELIPSARGALHESGLRVHSMRLPGLISHQEVYFGSQGELFTLRHDSFNTSCFLKGIILAIKGVMTFDELKVGLDAVL